MPLPEGLDPVVITHRWFASAYHWTPDQVGDLPLDDYDWLPTVEEAAHEARNLLTRQEANRPAGPQTRR